VFLILVIHQLDLASVRELHSCSNRQLKLSPLGVVIPHLVPLEGGREVAYIVNTVVDLEL